MKREKDTKGTYLVTGVAGFIGAKVAELLLRGGSRVIGVDDLNDSCDVRLKQWRLDRLRQTASPLADDAFRFQRLDIGRRLKLKRFFQQAQPLDAVFNLAARAGVRQSVKQPWRYFDANVTGTLNLLHWCAEHGVGKFVQASTSSLYGQTAAQPMREDHSTDRPLSPYAASKKAAEALCYSYHRLHGLDVTVFRYFTVYGPAGRPDMSPFRFVQWIAEGRPVKIYGDGSQLRDFTFIDDVARGTLLGLKPMGYEVLNLGSGRPLELLRLVRLLEKLLGRPARLEHHPRQAADVDSTWAEVTKADRLLDWRPQVRFEEGVSALVQWYRSNRDWAQSIRTE